MLIIIPLININCVLIHPHDGEMCRPV